MRTYPFKQIPKTLTKMVLAVVCIVAMLFSTIDCLALDETQQAVLAQAQNFIKNANYDLEAARGSAGTPSNPAKGSRVRLTEMRLKSAQQRLDQAKESLDQLPADDQAVTPVLESYNAVAAGIEEVNAIIHPPAQAKQEQPTESEDKEASDDSKDEAPADNKSTEESNNDASAPSAPAATTAQPEQAPKLHYTQEKLVKDANWYVRETNSYADKAAAVLARFDGEGDEPKPVHREVRDALQNVATGKEKHKLAVGYIEQLPADHPQVKPVADAVKQAGDRIGALDSRLQAIDAELAKLTGMENYPNYDKDFELLGDFARRYYDFNMSVQQPEQLAKVISEDGQVMSEVQRIAKTYLPLVEQRTPQGDKLEKLFNHFQTKRNQFAQALIAYKEQLPGLFEADLQEAAKLADEGVAKQNAMYFGPESGIAQRFGWAEQKLIVIRALGDEEAKPYVDRLEEVRNQIKQRAKALEVQIIANNQLPSDAYTGADRDDVVAIAVDGWKHQQPDAEVLMARIPSQAWARETRWEWFNGSFYKVDKSTLQVQLIVKHDDKLAVKRPINVRKDHLKGETMIGIPLDSFEDELIPQRYILLEKVK